MRKMTRLQLKGENCKHRWAAKGDSNKYTTSIVFYNCYYTTHSYVFVFCVKIMRKNAGLGGGRQPSVHAVLAHSSQPHLCVQVAVVASKLRASHQGNTCHHGFRSL